MAGTLPRDLFDLALKAQGNAYAPYSNHPVGAAVRTASGAIYAGCNVENAALPSGLCAEASAVAAMVAAGEQDIAEVVVVGPGDALCAPCGSCRQRLNEFAAPETPVYICGPEGLRLETTLGALLPHAFGPRNLGRQDQGETSE